ncbi:acyl-CoA N-acyltransferase [Fistulina hepatica ATCC 64428]|uniref:Acyl-CoA N-acyltransferase n=1 Tax=Fistulina hepatica ATCC 64428 TaxID=1128425 RepID=A0A0D7A7P0_9AGAR|nr:acyl-CoA N-acyltransferase [Fistulina hepatica ATCC 64428]
MLTTPHLTLRPLDVLDAPFTSALLDDPRIRPTHVFARGLPVDDKLMVLVAVENTSLNLKSSHRTNAIGLVTLSLGSQPRSCALGIAIHPDHWGCGYGTEAVEAMIHHSFVDLGFRSMELKVCRRNCRARALYERLGFTEDARIRIRRSKKGNCRHIVQMSLSAENWAVAPARPPRPQTREPCTTTVQSCPCPLLKRFLRDLRFVCWGGDPSNIVMNKTWKKS